MVQRKYICEFPQMWIIKQAEIMLACLCIWCLPVCVFDALFWFYKPNQQWIKGTGIFIWKLFTSEHTLQYYMYIHCGLLQWSCMCPKLKPITAHRTETKKTDSWRKWEVCGKITSSFYKIECVLTRAVLSYAWLR